MRRLRWSGVAAVLAAVACTAETEEGVGLQLVLDTDMAVPKSVNRVGLYVQHTSNGRTQMLLSREEKPIYNPDTGGYSVRFAATLAIQGNDADPSDRVRARFIAFDENGAAMNMREMATAIPTESVRAVRLPLLYLNQGQVVDTQPGKATPSGADVELQQQADEDDGSSVFTRYRMRSCGEEQTLDERGACVSINVTARPLSELETEEKDTCIEPTTCFGAGPGVRTLPLVGCEVAVPRTTDGVESVALAVQNPQGYIVDGEGWQPVDGALYEYLPEKRSIQLTPALCERVKGTTHVRVSAKCAAKQSGEAICAEWRAKLLKSTTDAGPTTRDPNDGLFTDDPGAPDGGQLPDGGDGGNDGGDSGPDASTPEIPSWDPVVVDDWDGQIESFAADPNGNVWWLNYSYEDGMVRRANANEVVRFPDVKGDIELVSVNGERVAYIGSDSALVRIRPSESIATLMQVADDFGVCSDVSDYMNIGQSGERLVAVYTQYSRQPNLVGGLFSTEGTCLSGATSAQPSTEDLMYSSPSRGRGSAFGTSWYIPHSYYAEHTGEYLEGLLEVDYTGNTYFRSVPFSNGDSPPRVYPESFVTLSNEQAVVVAVSDDYSDGNYISYTHFFGFSGGSAVRRLSDPVVGHPTREVFAGAGKLCLRYEDMVSGAGDYPLMRISCYQLNEQRTELVKIDELTIPDAESTHLYGDDTYVYFARSCPTGTGNALKVKAIPWSSLASAPVEECAPPFD